MESSFRRLWRRKKNKDVVEPARTGPANTLPRKDSIAADGRLSSATSHPFDKLEGQDYFRVTSGEYPRTKSGNRVQPILIGISRPNDPSSRPETAVSLNTAVQRAADTARGAQDKLRNQSSSARSHHRSKSGRSIDIFRVTGKLAGYKSRFNEEIAERNSEVAGSVQDSKLESMTPTQHVYVPTSRYQEEVADRNASGLFGSRVSLEYERATSLTSRATQSPVTSPKQPHTRNQASISSRPSYEQPAYHSRQYSLKSRDGGQPLPAIIQERANEDSYVDQSPQNITTFEQLKSLKPATRLAPFDTKPLPELPPPEPVPPLPDIRVATRQISSSHSKPDSVNFSTPAKIPPKNPNRNVPNETRSLSRKSARSPSRLSTGQPAERRIMDLTSEDGFSEASSSMYGYSQYSPVLEHANASHFGRTYRTSQRPTSSKLTADDVDLIPEQPLVGETVRTTEKSKLLPDKQAATTSQHGISFSGINTLASVPPRGHNVKLASSTTNASSQSGMISDRAVTVAEDEALPVEEERDRARRRKQPLREDSMSRVQRAAAALEARSASQSPKLMPAANSDVVKLRSFMVAKRQSTESLEKPRSANRVSPGPFAAPRDKTIAAEKAVPDIARAVNAPTTEKVVPAPAKQKIPKRPQNLNIPSNHESPDNHRSVDDTSPVNSFGIRTRDFAITPIKSAKPLRKKSDPQLLQRTATENAFKAGNEARSGGAKSEQKGPIKAPPKRPIKSAASRSASAAYVLAPSEFDEEAFAKKQAEAKAALARLQESLNEDFLVLPKATPPKDKIRVFEDDSSPVAPSSIVYPQSILTQSIERPTLSRTQTQDSAISPASFRSAVSTMDRAPSATSTHARLLASSSRKAAPAPLKNIEAASAPINQAMLPPSLQQILLHSTQSPKSPGEISLSAFPIPSSRPGSQHENIANMSRPMGYPYMRRNSNRSQTSVASQFSIPFQMVPERSSSYRDALMEEDDSS